MSSKSSATIADVARHAGVSTATVSRLINGIGPVSDGTEKRVRTAIEKLNYSPKRKRRTRGGESGGGAVGAGQQRPIAFLRIGSFPAQDRTPVTEHLVSALHRAANALGRTLTVHHIPDLPSTDIRQVIGDAQGVLLRTSNLNQFTKEAVAWLNGVPAVQVLGENHTSRLWIDHVTPDNGQAGVLAAEYLLEKGAKKLVFAVPAMIGGVALERCVSFVRAASEAGVPVHVLMQAVPGDLRPYEKELAGFSVKCKALASRMDLVREISAIKARPFGLFIPTDLELAMIMPQLQMMDLQFGKEVFAIGCDHETRCLTGLEPLPATMDLHLDNIAARAIRRLLFRIEHLSEPLVRICVAPRLVLPEHVLDLRGEDGVPMRSFQDMLSADAEA